MSNSQPNSLLALSPLDGRYQNKCDDLAPYFSEFGLMRYRVLVEVKWLQKLAATPAIKELGEIDSADMENLNSLYADFSLDDAQRIKDIEKKTNHDVKAAEYFIKEKLEDRKSLEAHLEFVHFACTSEDINNLA